MATKTKHCVDIVAGMRINMMSCHKCRGVLATPLYISSLIV